MANNMIVESPTAAHRLRDGAMLVAIGRTMPRPPTISANPMKAARPGVMPTGPFFSDCALNFSYANSFNEPTAMKLFAYEKFKAQSEKKGPVGITPGLAAFIGFAEIVGGLGIVLPMATNIAPSLSLWAAVGLSTIMLLAIGFHLRRHESAVAPVILLLLAVFVVFGRFSHWSYS